ncbi:MAG: hypothetical protein QOF24_1129 [Verrucomicrobiota bacterium]|jgi:hypothetical protein
MKTTCLISIVASFFLLAGGLDAQTSEEGKVFAKNWLRMSCIEAADSQDEQVSFVKYKEELKAYFISAIQSGLELNEMREEETALGQIYDQNIKTVNEDRPAWITPEYENKIRSVSREVFISSGKETLAQNYKARALRGLELIRSLPSK